MTITFAHPWILIVLAVIPLLVVWYVLRYRKQHSAIQYSNFAMLQALPKTFRQRLRPLPFALRMVALAAIIVALARPQSKLSFEKMKVEGIDIVVSLDVSGSMLAEDFSPNRLEAAKSVAQEFIDGRQNDRIGLVVFAGETFTQVPLTIDHRVLSEQLAKVKSGNLRDGTALGDGLATAINRIKDSKAKSKVIILLTDGVNNQGSVDPQSAAEIAAMYNIRLYTIGVGKMGMAPYPFRDQFGRIHYQNVKVEIDEPLLRTMAANTDHGQYFRATDKKSLRSIFQQIDKMEKTRIDAAQYSQTKDEFLPLLLIALGCLLAEILIETLLLRRI